MASTSHLEVEALEDTVSPARIEKPDPDDSQQIAVAGPSVLFATPPTAEPREPQPLFSDLNLDQVVDAITLGREQYRLKPFFWIPLHHPDAIVDRQEVVRELRTPEVRAAVEAFAARMRAMRERFTQLDKLFSRYQREALFRDAAEIYCEAVRGLAQALGQLPVAARALKAFSRFLADYVASSTFASLEADTARLRQDLASVVYCVHLRGQRVVVTRYEGQPDYSAQVLATFDKFAQAEASDYRLTYRGDIQMNQVEAQVLQGVARLYPEVFAGLEDYCQRWRHFLHPTIATFDREIQFYLAYLEFVDRMAGAGLEFCEPTLSASKDIEARDTFDVALANRLVAEGWPVVRNDFWLKHGERILVITGPNQGGKTTLARTFGQLHYLASLGLPVPGSKVRVVVWDHLFTHFEKEEDLVARTGKLEEELLRLRQIFEQATPQSIVVLNEVFSSTSLKDATLLGRKVIQRLLELDLVGVYVTFIDELSSLDERTVSMVSTVDPEDPSIRTYKVVRKPADGRAYAIAIAEKYGLTYARLRERLR